MCIRDRADLLNFLQKQDSGILNPNTQAFIHIIYLHVAEYDFSLKMIKDRDLIVEIYRKVYNFELIEKPLGFYTSQFWGAHPKIAGENHFAEIS